METGGWGRGQPVVSGVGVRPGGLPWGVGTVRAAAGGGELQSAHLAAEKATGATVFVVSGRLTTTAY